MIDQAAMGPKYNQLTSQERDLIGIWLAEGRSMADIGRQLGRSTSTIGKFGLNHQAELNTPGV